MSIDNFLEVPEDKRTIFIQNNIPKLLLKEKGVEERITQIADNYLGVDVDALSILAYAAERGTFNEFAGKLEKFYVDNLIMVHPGARRVAQVPGAMKAAAFFMQCYHELGVRERTQKDGNFIQTHLPIHLQSTSPYDTAFN